jgi:hypothetical protein
LDALFRQVFDTDDGDELLALLIDRGAPMTFFVAEARERIRRERERWRTGSLTPS